MIKYARGKHPNSHNHKCSEDTKKKISIANTGRVRSVETRIKMRQAKLGKKLSEKHIVGMKNKKLTDIHKLHISAGLTGKKHTEERINKVKAALTGKPYPIDKYPDHGWRSTRKKQVFPVRDTNIEVKIQNFLKLLEIDFYTHQYIKDIEHRYQCDILIPVQKNILQKTIIECDGNYWHNLSGRKELDDVRTKELIEIGFRVIRLWGEDIKSINILKFKDRLNLK